MAARKRTLKSLEPKQPHVPASDDPRAELRRLVRQHKAAVKSKVAMDHMASDRTARSDFGDWKKGDTIPCRLPDDVRATIKKAVDDVDKEIDALERKMTVELRKVPIYKHFLSKVFGVGPVVAGYLCAEIDIAKCTKVSQLIRFCGLAVIDGKLERPKSGERNHFNGTLRTQLFLWASMARQNGRHVEADPDGRGKYLKIWRDKKHGLMTLKGKDPATDRDGAADKAGWHVAARVLIEDLYIVWRTLDGLPVWPSYRAAKLGYSHGGKVCVDAPRMLTLDEALDAVGASNKPAAEAAE